MSVRAHSCVASAKERARPPWPRHPRADRRPLDEPAARAGRPGADRAHARRPGGGRRATSSRCCATRDSAAPARQGGGIGLAEPARAWCRRRSGSSSRPAPIPRCSAIFGMLAKPGDVVLSEKHHLSRHPLDRGATRTPARRPADGRGRHRRRTLSPMPASGLKPKALYLNPTLQNPTTLHHPGSAARGDRRGRPALQRADHRGRCLRLHTGRTARRRSRRIAPDLTWHIGGLAKCIGAGLRARLCRRSGRAVRLAVRRRAAGRQRDGLAADRGARHPLDRGRHRRRAPALHPCRESIARQRLAARDPAAAAASAPTR